MLHRRAGLQVVAAGAASVAGVATRRAKPTWQQSMLRIKDPEKSLEFYRDKMGMRFPGFIVWMLGVFLDLFCECFC